MYSVLVVVTGSGGDDDGDHQLKVRRGDRQQCRISRRHRTRWRGGRREAPPWRPSQRRFSTTTSSFLPHSPPSRRFSESPTSSKASDLGLRISVRSSIDPISFVSFDWSRFSHLQVMMIWFVCLEWRSILRVREGAPVGSELQRPWCEAVQDAVAAAIGEGA